jgi:membrane protease YdiL (CAAX protease family)
MPDSTIDDDLNKPLNPTKSLNQKPVEAQILIWFGVFFSCFFIAQLISGGIIIWYYKSMDLKQIVSNTSDLNVLRLAQNVATVFGFLAPALIFSNMKSHRLTRYSNADKGFPLVLLIVIPLLIVTIYPLINASFFLNKLMPWNDWLKSSQGEYKLIVDALLHDNSLPVFVFNFITIAALPAVCEEWIFRGTLQKILSEKLNIHWAIFGAAVFFSFIHFEFSGFLPRILLGMFLGYVYYYSGSLWASIIAHLVNNGAQIILVYLSQFGIYKGNVDQPEMPHLWELIIYTSGFIASAYIFYYFTQMKKKQMPGKIR